MQHAGWHGRRRQLHKVGPRSLDHALGWGAAAGCMSVLRWIRICADDSSSYHQQALCHTHLHPRLCEIHLRLALCCRDLSEHLAHMLLSPSRRPPISRLWQGLGPTLSFPRPKAHKTEFRTDRGVPSSKGCAHLGVPQASNGGFSQGRPLRLMLCWWLALSCTSISCNCRCIWQRDAFLAQAGAKASARATAL